MAAVDYKGRTASSLEHQLRKHRHAGKELAEKKAAVLQGLGKSEGGARKRKSGGEEGGKSGAAKKGRVDGETDGVEGESPAKKARVVKKGTAKIVKKGIVGGTKAKANARPNGKVKRGKNVEAGEDADADGDGRDVEEGDTGVGEEDGDVEEDDNGMVEMQFER